MTENELFLIKSEFLTDDNILLMEDKTLSMNIPHYGDGDNTALVLGGFAALFVLICFIWTGMMNFRARRNEKRIEKLKIKLVTKL